MAKSPKPIRLTDLTKAELIDVVRALAVVPSLDAYAIKDVVLKSLRSKYDAAQRAVDAACDQREVAWARCEKTPDRPEHRKYLIAAAEADRLVAEKDAAFDRLMAAYDREVEL